MSFLFRKQKQELQINLQKNIDKLKEIELNYKDLSVEDKEYLLKWLISENIKLSTNYLEMFKKVNI